jgi:chemotaxis protein histidine kinase CheA
MTEVTEAGIGHNHPPPFDQSVIDSIRADASALVEANREWLQKGSLESDEQAARAADHVSGLRKLKKRAEEGKTAAKKPHDAAAKLCTAAYSPVIDGIEKMIRTTLAMQTEFLNLKQEELNRQRREAEAEAARQRAEAEAAAQAAAQANDPIAEAAALNAVKAAEKAEKQAARVETARVGTATGAGGTIAMRTRRVARIVNARALLIHYQDHPDILEALQRLANAHVRAANFDGNDLPGTKTENERTAA